MNVSSPTTNSVTNGKSRSIHSFQEGFRPVRVPGRTDNPLVRVEQPRREDLQPSYAKVLGAEGDDSSHGWYGPMINALGSCIGFMGAFPCCILCPNPYKPVNQGNVGLVTKFGRFYRAVDPGLVKVNPLSERLIQVDVKIQIVEVPQQVCMTKDNVTLHLTSVIYYHITSPHKAAFGISNVRQALVERSQTTLRHVIGALALQELVERREEVASSIGEIIEDVASSWGVQVESMLIKDIIFSGELQESLSMAAQSKRIGESKVITARAEVEAAKLMRQAADILSSAPAMQIRYLEAMQAMAKSANSKVIFLPATNQTLQSQMAMADTMGEGPSRYGANPFSNTGSSHGQEPDGMKDAMSAQILQSL
ncbi:MAG: hypothetical protein M1829_004463 [Trizodia sp. TS-e1964]|nr:MAG: hypothetical protein M1829_004463 [Trizodia sp. TS-e1964]